MLVNSLRFARICDAKNDSAFTKTQFGRIKSVVEEVRRQGVRIPMLHLENSESLHADCISEDEFKHLLADGTQGYLLRGGAIYGQCSHVEVAPASP